MLVASLNPLKKRVDMNLTPSLMNQLSYEKKIQILNALVEGNSLRSITRMLDVHRTTVMRVLIEAGDLARTLLNERVRNLKCNYVQCDEIWG